MIPMPHFARWRAVALFTLLLSACSPEYNWREVRGNSVPFSVTMPGKASEYARPINLGGVQVSMTMTATDVGGATYAVGTAIMPDAAQAQAALGSMKTALLKNINGQIVRERGASAPYSYIEVEAKGRQLTYGNEKNVLLLGRFVARDKRIYQVIVAGEDKAKMREAADTFLTSFKPD